MAYIEYFWTHPKLTLAFLAFMQLIMYFDRGVVAAALPMVKENWELSSTEEGIIASAFTIGFMVVSPLWANLAMKFRANKVISAGNYMFAIAAILGGVFGEVSKGRASYWGYVLFVISRVVVGLGESAIVSLVITIVDDISPKKYKSTYMSIFMCTTPVGVALGYGVSGAVMAYLKYWQLVFYVEGAIMFCLTTLCLFVPLHDYQKYMEPDHPDNQPEEENVLTMVASWRTTAFVNDVQLFEDMNAEGNIDTDEVVIGPGTIDATSTKSTATNQQQARGGKKVTLLSSFKLLIKNPVYVCIVIISCVYGAIIGALTFWAPSYILYRLEKFDISEEARLMAANIGFSLIVLVSSIVATGVGGFLLDKSGGPTGWMGVSRSLFWCVLYISIGAPLGLVVFLALDMHYIGVFIVFFLAIFSVLCIASPFQVALINCVQPELRHFANSYQILFLHAFGDLPSPFLVGVISDATDMNIAFLVMWCALFPGLIVLGIGGVLARRKGKAEAAAGINAMPSSPSQEHAPKQVATFNPEEEIV
ncbi:sphingolipid transporter Spinster [Acrasis kona]|uniref:Sphingolipid transporter Spinster n=1 Tax=Acrasis kona TaxID=1008807 RepID=A0AAW2YXW9_9EUKA